MRRDTNFLVFVGGMTILSMPLSSAFLGTLIINISLPNVFLLTFVYGYVLLTFFRPRLTLDTFPFVMKIYLGLIVWVFLAPLASEFPSLTYHRASPFVGAVLFFVVGTYVGRRTDGHWVWSVPLIIGALGAAVTGIGHYLNIIPLFDFESAGVGRRELGNFVFAKGYTGLIIARGDYGIWLAGGSIFAIRAFFESKNFWLRALVIVAIAIFSVAVMLSLSRSSWLALFVSFGVTLPLVWIVAPNLARKVYSRMVLLGIFLILLMVAFILTGVFSKIINPIIAMQGVTVENRISGFLSAFRAFIDYPIFGYGAGVDMAYVAHHHIIHNTFLYFLAAYGAPGFLLFFLAVFSPYIKALNYALNNPDYQIRLQAAIWVGWLSGAIIEMSLFNGFASKYFWLLLGLMCGELHKIHKADLRKAIRARHFKTISYETRSYSV